MGEGMLEHIKTGEKNKRTRAELMALTGYSDRRVRREIEELQLQGYPIVNLGNGYFLADNNDRLVKYCKRERRRAYEIHRKVSIMMFASLK